MAGPIERELKFRVEDLDALRRALESAGATLVTPRAFEDNRVWDRAGELRERGCVLRLRRDGRGERLTFKGQARFVDRVKERVEHETAVECGDTVAAIFEQLGFELSRRYQKVREEWRLGETLVALDRTPMGSFAEFEGQDIRACARRFGLEVEQAESGSYFDLWEDYRRDQPALSEDMIFDPLPPEATDSPGQGEP